MLNYFVIFTLIGFVREQIKTYSHSMVPVGFGVRS